MVPDRDDGMEEEPLEFEEEGRAEGEHEEGAPRRGPESVLAGISPNTLKLVLAGVIVLAVALVVLTSRYKKVSVQPLCGG
jgi:hypothetical protein